MKLFSLFILLLSISFLTPTTAWVWPSDISNPNTCYPDQIHISLGDAYYNSINKFASVTPNTNSNSSVIIVWQTQTLCDNFFVVVQNKEKTFKLTITSGEIWNELEDEFVSDRKNKMPLPNGTLLNGTYTSYSHTAYVSGLKTGAFYTYQLFQTNSTNNVSDIFTFTLPEMSPKNTEKPIKFALYADIDTVFTNVTLDAFTKLHGLHPWDIDFHLFLGDLGYDLFSINGLRGEWFYNSWQSVLASYPFMVTPGNHEIYTNYSFLNFRTRMPLYNKTSNHYYSFNVGKAHILAINYYFYRDNPAHAERMFKWMEDDLKAAVANRNERPWIFIATHQPIYCSLNDLSDEPDKRCYNFYERWARFDELYQKYRVDMVLQGHVHNWERTGPTYKNKSLAYDTWSVEKTNNTHMINPKGPVYTIEGAAGNSYFMAGNAPLADYSKNIDSTLSFSTITIVNSSALKYEHINSQNGKVIDYFFILKGDEYIRPFYKTPTFWILAGLLVGLIVLIVIYMERRSSIRKGGLLTEKMLGQQDSVLENAI